ncbi:Retrovirus-related Pol polyprotein from transposon 412, partial [Araneus ventricosus]
MSSLTKYRKSELIALAADLNVELLPNDSVVNILTKIKESPDYDADFALDTIKCIREEKGIEEKRLERQEAEAAQIREYELEKLRLTQSNDTASVRSNASNGSQNYRIPSIKSVLSPFDPEKSDVSLFLTVFKRQADKLGIPDEELVTQLISVLPANMTELIIRDTGDDTDDFEVVKKILLERFRLSTDAYRVKYMTHQKGVNSLWKDLVFELNSYFNGWLEGAEVDTFEKLKDLMIADQIKRRASPEIKTHFVDKWGQMNDPYVVASNFDQYELARKTLRKPQQNKPFDKPSFKRTNSFRKNGKEGEKNQEGAKSSNWRQRTKSDETRRSEQFERRKKPACYSCGSLSHLRPSCPELRKPEQINKLSAKGEFHEVFKPYLKVGKIFGLEMEVLRDTGGSVDLISFKNVKESDLTGDYVWARQALTNEHTCLALAEIDLEIDGVRLKTKAAVLDPSVEMKHYLLGNKTQELIDAIKKNPYSPELINLVVTRSQTKAARTEKGDEFRGKQINDPSLEGLFDKAGEENSEFQVDKGVLFRIAPDKKEGIRKQLVIPEELREKILKLCHNESGTHVGITKTKDRLLRNFFWPNIIKETENYVRCCDPCQRIGHAGEKKKAPLKLVPIISEIFTKLNCDITGPLPESEKGNKYLFTVMCLASKYPDAIPLKDIKSESIVEALLLTFSRFGFPREVSCDLGSCFTSNLTSTFLEKFGIKVRHSSVHHPESNPIERFHRTVKRLLKVICLENARDWEKNLPAALLALRTVDHDTTGFSPSELVHGRNLRTPERLLFEKWAEPEEENSLVTEYVFELLNRFQKYKELAMEKASAEQIKRKTWYDKKAISREFKIGDQVLILATHKTNKFAVNWVGPGVIDQKLSDTNYIVKRLDKKEKSQIYHINMLKPYYKRAERVNLLLTDKRDQEVEENDLEIDYPETHHTEINLEEIIQASELEGHATEEDLKKLRKVLNQHREVFSNEPGKTDLIEHDIELISDKPIRCKPYRTSPRQNEILRAEIKK